MNPIRPSEVLFIKLGSGGEWEEECILRRQIIKLGFDDADHDQCLRGEWDEIHKFYEASYKQKGNKYPSRDATTTVNAIACFYKGDPRTLWLTFYANRLWWCFAEKKVFLEPGGTKVRHAIGQWSCKDIAGQELTRETLSGKLLKTQGFRGTICSVDEQDYALKRINGEKPDYVIKAHRTLRKMQRRLRPLFEKLTWQDFEILVDLIFRQAGWNRVGAIGGTTKMHDLDLFAPVTGERCLVQIKSSASKRDFENYCAQFKNMLGYDRFFFVVHSPTPELASLSFHDTTIRLLLPDQLAELALDSGLSNWLISKVS